MDELSRAAEVSGVGDAGRDMAQIFECALDAYLQKHDPRQRQARREKKATRKALAEAEAAARKVTNEPVANDDDRQDGARSRTIPPAVRDRLLIGAGHRCEYTSSEGLRCSKRSHLAIDHIVPWGLGDTSAAENLRVLCVAHNRLHADRCFGAEFMDRKIESTRSTSTSAREGRPGGYQ